ncbi:ATP-binding protein PhnN [Vibrio maritimus]|uniref:ATP-binding protein PhnN n=1 Tax=Vibrio maritimus TaxID=990268 RepID=A0A090S1G0_9VIBR|nr:ATP-binding protein PhnN [Vibrio maritimus]
MIDVLNLEASSDASFSSTPSSMSKATNTKGKLYYIVGPSGAGKDTLIDAIRAEFPEDIIVAHRYITRPFGLVEKTISLSAKPSTSLDRPKGCLR